MNNSKHTPGPWIQNGVYIGVHKPFRNVARVMRLGVSEIEAQANARLIAAAPELLEALKMASRSLYACAAFAQEQGNPEMGRFILAWASDSEQATAKAEGRE